METYTVKCYNVGSEKVYNFGPFFSEEAAWKFIQKNMNNNQDKWGYPNSAEIELVNPPEKVNTGMELSW